ncbi:MAG: gluconate 2-dehydrogenase subunit 3 family protein [Bacteroidota bacterium]
MQRRSAIKNLALTIGSAIILPSWANAWNRESLQNSQVIIFSSQENLLAEIVETIIPKTDTLGAKELNIHQFTVKMVADCYDKKAQDIFKKGLDSVDALAKKEAGKAFVECDGKQKLDILSKMSNAENSDDKAFVRLVKNLVIQGYLNSEYVMTNLRKFEFAPGHYYGCVPVKK